MGRDDHLIPTPDSTPQKKKRRRKGKRWGHAKARNARRGEWTLSDPCLYCKHPGPHKTERKGRLIKATCGKCGKYQKFVSESQLGGAI